MRGRLGCVRKSGVKRKGRVCVERGRSGKMDEGWGAKSCMRRTPGSTGLPSGHWSADIAGPTELRGRAHTKRFSCRGRAPLWRRIASEPRASGPASYRPRCLVPTIERGRRGPGPGESARTGPRRGNVCPYRFAPFPQCLAPDPLVLMFHWFSPTLPFSPVRPPPPTPHRTQFHVYNLP